MWAQNPKFKAILAREKYLQGGHGKENDDDVDAGQGDVLATSAFLAHFMKKVERLEKAGEKTRWKKGESGEGGKREQGEPVGEGGKRKQGYTVGLTIWEGIVWRQRKPTNLRLMIVLLLFLQKQNLAYAVYQFGSVLSLPD